MRALTLWQPWASLVALGVKAIETRSWGTAYRGPLLIHAAVRPPERGQDVGPWHVYAPEQSDERWRLTMANPDYRKPDGYRPDRSLLVHQLHLGAVVATCTLADVVPMVGADGCKDATKHLCIVNQSMLLHSALAEPWPDGQTEHVVFEQMPYGDFQPGRFAWVLADVQALPEPVAAKGRQGLWTPNQALLDLLP